MEIPSELADVYLSTQRTIINMAKFTAKAKGNFLTLAAAVQKSKVELCPQERENY